MDPFVSKKFRFYSFISMLLLVFVHGYNLHNRYLQPWTPVEEPLTFNSFVQYLFANGILRFRIPMLFAISGYLFAFYDDKPHLQRIIKRVKTLLVPYFTWSVIGLLIAVLLANWNVTKDVVYNTHLQPGDKPFEQYSLSDWFFAITWPTSYQLWFLRALFTYNLLYPLLLKGVLKVPVVLFVLFGLLWLVTFGMVFLEGEGLLFFTFGIWLCKKQKNLQALPKSLNLTILSAVFLLAAICKTLLAFKITNFNVGTWLLMSVLHKLVALTGLVVVWFGGDRVVRFFMDKKWFEKASAFSFIIYALHVPLITYLIDPTFQLLHKLSNYRLITFVFLPSVIIAFCISIGWILRKTLPGVYAVLTGGRGM